MIIQPRVRGFICTTAHPVGCAKHVQEQIDYIKAQPKFSGPKNVLIIGSSTGYGLASRIACAFGAGSKTIGIAYEGAASDKRTASAGWYNTAAFENAAVAENLYAKSINGDAFSNEIKKQTIDLIKQDLGQVDLVIYSLAAPRRTHPDSGEVFSSVLKPVGETYHNKTVDPIRGIVKDVAIEPAEGDDIKNTIAVMGGEDWEMWMQQLAEAGVLADNVTTMAYTYIGPGITHDIYKEGTIGEAKKHLQATADKLNDELAAKGGRALLSVNKALVTQASAAIPVVPLYISILYKLMKAKGTHEGCIEQMYRLLQDRLYSGKELNDDDAGRARLDDWEMAGDLQADIMKVWPEVNTESLEELTDIAGYRHEFYKLFGFQVEGVDYEADVNPEVAIPSIAE